MVVTLQVGVLLIHYLKLIFTSLLTTSVLSTTFFVARRQGFMKVTVVPAKTPASEVLAMNPDGVFLSNGPADPQEVTYAIEVPKKFLVRNQ